MVQNKVTICSPLRDEMAVEDGITQKGDRNVITLTAQSGMDRDQIWHTYSDTYGTGSHLTKIAPPHPRGVPGGLGGIKIKSPGNVTNCPENQ